MVIVVGWVSVSVCVWVMRQWVLVVLLMLMVRVVIHGKGLVVYRKGRSDSEWRLGGGSIYKQLDRREGGERERELINRRGVL